MTTHCRVCDQPILKGKELARSPSLTSVLGLIDGPTVVYLCDQCGHAQSANMQNTRDYYDKQYRISLDTEQHDQLLTSVDLQHSIYRTEYQAKLCLDLCEIPKGALVLDFGAAQAKSLRWLLKRRPDIVPHVYDVSADYMNCWNTWIGEDQQAVYDIPTHWQHKFDVVTSYFVLEHVENPVDYLKKLAGCVKIGGQIFMSFPNVHLNPGDMMVVDHVNHFTRSSLKLALQRADLQLVRLENDPLLSSFFIIAELAAKPTKLEESVREDFKRNTEICTFWREAALQLEKSILKNKQRNCAIYGAGFYGSWLMSQIQNRCKILTFIDMNKKLWNTKHLDIPVVSPTDLPEEIETIFVGLNPLKARVIISNVPEFRDKTLHFVWLE